MKESRCNLEALQNIEVAKDFCGHIEARLQDQACEAHSLDIDVANSFMNTIFEDSAKACLPVITAQPRRPWTSARTLRFIDERNAARSSANIGEEKRMIILVKKSVQQDKCSWFHAALSKQDWNAIRKLKKGFVPHQGRIKNEAGELVSSEHKAETMASFFEKMQWHVRADTSISDQPPIFDQLPVSLSDFTREEILHVISKLQKKKSPGHDGIPAEFWIACVGTCTRWDGLQRKRKIESEPVLEWLLQFCNLMWQNKSIPTAWHKARVACLYKKGDPAMPDNYRPISLLAIGYKMFASLLLLRLKKAGAEERITDTQFGFKSKSGTREALFLVRRMIEQSWLKKDHKFIMLALDWSKAFDSISPASLLQALRRFGIPQEFVSMIAGIYTDRCFFIQDAFAKSEDHVQHFGISQGCPLSPFLFVIVMTVLMHDAVDMMKNQFGIEFTPALICHAILYADDTLLLEVDEAHLQKFMECIMQLGVTYGLNLNWDKVECMPIQCECHLTDILGNAIKQKSILKYLGANIASSGIVTSELAQKISLAESDFKTLVRV